MTIKTGRELLDSLQKNSKIEWAKYPIYKGTPRSSAVVWRFSNEVSEIQKERIIGIIQFILDNKTDFPWVLRFSGRNWIEVVLEIRTVC